MSSNPQTNPDNQEIDLSQVSKRIGKAFEDFSTWIFRGFLFVKRNIVILAILFVIGAGIGYYLDKSTKVYDHQIIVSPNFGSVDYLYSKINLLGSKIKERDSVFLKGIGIKNPKKLLDIKIKPIVDVYTFIENRPENFELIKLMSENGDVGKVVADDVTSKNYPKHMISFSTQFSTDEKATVEPIMTYLNNSNYYSDIQKVYNQNVELTIKTNDSILKQIDGILNEYGKAGSNRNGDKLVYFNNENTQLNDIIKTKSELLSNNSNIKIEKVRTDAIVKNINATTNIRNTESVNGKMKFIVPLIFIGIFIILVITRSFYRNQINKQLN